MDINSLPFPVAESFDELCNHIRNFDSDVYLEKLAQMKQKMGFCENGDATAKAGDFIYKLLEDT
jgi:putative hemolysin